MSEAYGVTSILGILSAIIAIVALIIERQGNRTALKTQLLINLNEQWASRENKMLRRRVARNLLAKRTPNFELGELLDFISMICYMYNSNAVDTRFLSDQFSWWIVRYWLCAAEWIKAIRLIDPQGWKSVELLANKLMKMEEKEGRLRLSPEDLKHFLQVEAQLFVLGD